MKKFFVLVFVILLATLAYTAEIGDTTEADISGSDSSLREILYSAAALIIAGIVSLFIRKANSILHKIFMKLRDLISKYIEIKENDAVDKALKYAEKIAEPVVIDLAEKLVAGIKEKYPDKFDPERIKRLEQVKEIAIEKTMRDLPEDVKNVLDKKTQEGTSGIIPKIVNTVARRNKTVRTISDNFDNEIKQLRDFLHLKF